MEQQWNGLGALANSVLRQVAEARDANVGQLREAEAAQGETAFARLGSAAISAKPAVNGDPAEQLELPLA